MTVEALILIPSVVRRERELLAQIQEISSAKVTWLLVAHGNTPKPMLLEELKQLDRLSPAIFGGERCTIAAIA
ncbi:MAG: hypothetical protein HC925_07420, partial [Coleofasciculaceae cyanobacterium SM2_3_26]|nr:hypothetical protein [Coleofasciculaceae cyanobacterium SM2_3_26]